LWRRRRELGWAGVCALAFGILAALTTLTTVSAWDTQIVLAVNAVVATQAALRGVATAVTAVGSPASVDVLTAVAVGVACGTGTVARNACGLRSTSWAPGSWSSASRHT
jgi:hypothetical protein